MVEWNYKHDADITIGEEHAGKTTKIILICVFIAIAIIVGLGIYFKDYIYDLIANPEILLTGNDITVNVYDKFDPDSYIINKNDGYEYTVDGVENVDTSKLGQYIITYNSYNRMKSKSIEVTVNVVDELPPVIELTDTALWLTRGEETEKFDAKNYIKSITDNYSKPENIKVEYTDNLDKSSDQWTIIYTAIDEAGNQTTEQLVVKIFDSEEALRKQKEEEERQKQLEEQSTENTTEATERPVEPATEKHTTKPTEKQTTKPTEKQTTKPTEKPVEQTTERPTEKKTEAPPTEKPTEKETEKPTEEPVVVKPEIKGKTSYSFPVNTSVSDVLVSVLSGIYSTTGSAIQGDPSGVNVYVPGTYKMKVTTDDGASKTLTIKITE